MSSQVRTAPCGAPLRHRSPDDRTLRTKALERRACMDRVIEPLASGLGDSVGWLADHGVLFGLFAILWVAFGAALIWSQGSVDQAWATINGLPLILRLIVWVLFLPVMAGLWVWETSCHSSFASSRSSGSRAGTSWC